jgi:alpha-D-xyloside xylohydrolase
MNLTRHRKTLLVYIPLTKRGIMHYTPHGAPAGFDWVTGYDTHHLSSDARTLTLTTRTAADARLNIAFSAVTPHVWRVRIVIPGLDAEAPTPILIAQPAPLPLTVSNDDGRVTVRAEDGEVSLHIDLAPFCIRFVDAQGREITRENPFDIDGLGRPFILPLGFVADAEQPLLTETLHLRQDEHLFGLGEKFTPLDKVGQKIITWTQDAFGSTSERSHKNIPFVMSTRGYGLLLDTGARITWELGTVSCQSYTLKLEGTTLDAYVIAGETQAELLERYTGLTGRAPMPPRWSFGLWLSGSGVRRNRAAIEAMVEQAEAIELPVDVIHVDTWWMRWRHYADWKFDAEAFPNVETFIDGLHERGLRLSLWEQPYISIEGDYFEEGKAKGYFLTRPDGEVYVIDYGLSLSPRPDGIIRTAESAESWNAPVVIVDLTNPEAVAWFQDMHRPVLQLGVDVLKTDFGEDVPQDAVFSNGQTGKTLHNLYPLLYNEAVTEVMRQEKGYALVWSRSGTAGNQRYPVCWSGDPGADFDSLACTIRGGLSIGQSGVPFWSSDIGGYRGKPTPRLYVRWAQFTLFCSHARMHGDSEREPWEYGDEEMRIVRDFTRLRYRLFPYLYSTAQQATLTGVPVIRSMSLAFPEDENAYDKDLQYMLGDSLLVAPIYDESESRRVYLPEGAWFDWWTGEVIQGSRHITALAPLDRMPLYVRGGAIIPTIADTRRIPEQVEHLILNVYPHGESETHWYDDARSAQLVHTNDGHVSSLGWKGAMPPTVTLRFIGGSSLLSGPEDATVTRNGDALEVTITGAAEAGSVSVHLS